MSVRTNAHAFIRKFNGKENAVNQDVQDIECILGTHRCEIEGRLDARVWKRPMLLLQRFEEAKRLTAVKKDL